jgi:hypothetical protein
MGVEGAQRPVPSAPSTASRSPGATIQYGGQDDAYAPPLMITLELSTKF